MVAKRFALMLAGAAAASAFAPSAILPSARRATAATTSPSMQVFGEGKIQGKGVVAIPPLGRPETDMFDGTWAGDAGFDPLTISGFLDARWLREAELKHCRVAMLATLGCIVQDVYKFPGATTVFSGDMKLTKLHDAAVAQGTMGQMLVWLSFIEIFGTAATIQMLQGSGRKPGDFGFDPIGLGKGNNRSRLELAEIKNGRLAMLAFSGIVHHYFITGKGPIELITGA